MIQAVIFDLDGTILDNEGVWEEAIGNVIENGKLKIENYQTQPNGWIHEPGLGLEQNWKRILPNHPITKEQLVRDTVTQYKCLSLSLSLREGTMALIERVKERGWMTALCTGSTWNVVERELEELELQLAFDVTTTGEEVLSPKPDPEIYLLTAQKLSLEPEECLVIEDSIAGVRSAAEAGMQVMGLVSDYAPEEMLLAAGAKMVTEGLASTDLNML